MARHSKWHNIQVRKGKQDKMRANTFTKAARLITVAARQGGGDPEANFALRLAIERARAMNVPKENIERAVRRGTGNMDGEVLEEMVYGGFGPGGVAILVEAVTDNKNRTAGDLKHIFGSHGGSLGSPGSVQWQFQRCGVVRMQPAPIGASGNEKFRMQNDGELKLIEAGMDDICKSEAGVEIFCPVDRLPAVLETVNSFGLEPDDAGLEWVAKETMTLALEAESQVQALVEALEEHDDVKAVYTNLV